MNNSSAGESIEPRDRDGQQSGFLNFILGRFLKFQKQPAKSIIKGQREGRSPSQDKLDGPRHLAIPVQTAGSELHSLQPQTLVEPEQRGRGREWAQEDQAVPEASQQVHRQSPVPAAPHSEEDLASGETQQTQTAGSDSSDWNFSRRSGRSQRSAREWQRDSAVCLGDLDPKHSLSQLSDAISPEPLCDDADSKPVSSRMRPQNRDIEGVNQRSRPPMQRRYLTRGRASAEKNSELSGGTERPDEGHAHKRKSLEAGLVESVLEEKVGRLSTDDKAQLSDFYPTELEERSLLFNTKHNPLM